MPLELPWLKAVTDALKEVQSRPHAGFLPILILYSDGSGRVEMEHTNQHVEGEVIYDFDSLDELAAWTLVRESARPEFEKNCREQREHAEAAHNA